MQQTLLLLLVPLALIAGWIGATLMARSAGKHRDEETDRLKEELKNQFTGVAQEVLKNSNQQFLQLAGQRLDHEQTKAKAGLDQNKQAIDSSLRQMSETIEKYAALVKNFENDRNEKYGSLQSRLENTTQVTSKLQQTTDRLTSILGNVKLRGQWGERVAEDILRMSGFTEGTHYLKNKAQETVATRPDYVFLLPNAWKVCMDVKFPLDNYMALVNSETVQGRDSFQAEFIRDVKNRIKEITKRDYINTDEQTLDCVILFIPNEQVYGFIHEASPGLMDEAMKQRVILCSPFTLYAVLAIIRQSFEDFHFKKAAHEILSMIQGFQQDFDKFKSRFEDLGTQLQKASAKYQEITDVSYKRLDNRVRKIDEYRKGQGLLPQPDSAALPLLTTPEN